jgi:two-component system nitrate/nitrite sensor histidine kinase NarX
MQRPLPSDVKVALYRVAQEALNNVAKHSKANRVMVSLRDVASTEKGLGTAGAELCILDDGKGFDSTHASPEHFGLAIMRERAEAIGATLDIESRPGQGTKIAVVWHAAGADEPGKE